MLHHRPYLHVVQYAEMLLLFTMRWLSGCDLFPQWPEFNIKSLSPVRSVNTVIRPKHISHQLLPLEE
jgi:hypothetical protein